MTVCSAICLNMIVKNEAHIVAEVLDSVAPYISLWVIVDTGSTDGTQDVIRNHMASLGIPGELHERPWRSFGHNRSEAVDLAQGHGDYIWVIDADDLVVGAPDFSLLNADAYMLRYQQSSSLSYWCCQMFRDGLPWEYKGVVHEYVHCGEPYTQERLNGDYYVQSRRLGDRSRDPQKDARDRDLLLADIDQNADNERSVFYLAQSYFDLDDFANARQWYAKRVEMGRWDQEVYYSMVRLAESMAQLGEPWATTQQEYLRAWEFRPTRAEPLCAIASHYRKTNRFQLGYKFAEWAATIEMPDDVLFVASDVYQWRVLDEVSICASWLGRHAESFAACRKLLAKPVLPEQQRPRIAGNRDFAVAAMVAAAEACPREMVAGPRDLDVTVTLVAGSDRFALEKTPHSILNCCNDIDRSRRFLVVDCGLSAEDRESLKQNYGFLEFTRQGSTAEATWIRDMVTTRFWLHVTAGWTFFAPEPLIGRLIAVLEAEPDCTQVGVNVNDAVGLTGVSAPEAGVRRTADGSRYVIRNATVNGPAMFDTTRLDRAGTSVACVATLDEVLVLQTAT